MQSENSQSALTRFCSTVKNAVNKASEVSVTRAVLFIGLIAGVPVLLWVPEWIVNQSGRSGERLSREQYLKAVDDNRRTTAQIAAGLIGLYGVYLVFRRTKAVEDTLKATLENLELAKQTQITDRFTKAIEQLGATDNEGRKQLEIRLGGLYALERIARDSERDYQTILEILAAYVRANANSTKSGIPPDTPSSELARDVQATMAVLAGLAGEAELLDLAYVDLGGVQISGGKLRAGFFGSNLKWARFFGTDLSYCMFGRTDFSLGSFDKCNFEKAHFLDASLRNASLQGSNLSRTVFLGDPANSRGADIRGAVFNGANLEGALLRGAQLNGSILVGVNLASAHLTKSDLTDVDLSNSNLRETNLEDAILLRTRLAGVDLSATKGLTAAQLADAVTNELTVLPARLT